MQLPSLAKGLIALVATSILWGSSFPAIRVVVSEIGDVRYVWIRGIMAVLFLIPYMLHVTLRRRLDFRDIRGGLLAGIAYTLGLWLQGWGMRYTTASNAAFITGFNVVFVHLHAALLRRRYNCKLALSLALSLSGLYLLAIPQGMLNIGDALVLVGAVLQVRLERSG